MNPSDAFDVDRAKALVTLCLLEHVREYKGIREDSDPRQTFLQLVQLAGSEAAAANLLGSGAAALLVSLDGQSGTFDAEAVLLNGILLPFGAA